RRTKNNERSRELSVKRGSLHTQYHESGLTQPFDNHGICHAAALADRLEAIASAGSLQFIEQEGGETRPRCAQRMSDSNRAAIDIHLRHIRLPFALPGQNHTGK